MIQTTLNRFISRAIILATVGFMFWTAPLNAADGVFEINQDCVALGCFPGDQSGFPVQIYNGGSYILTSDLDVRGEDNPQNVTAIEILLGLDTDAGTHIDLNGFRMFGPNDCSGAKLECDNEGSGVGIKSTFGRITVRNGMIQGFGDDGIQIGAESRVENMQVIDNAGNGINVALRSMVVGNICFQNGVSGIKADGPGFVKDNLSTGNGAWGLDGTTTVGYANNVFISNASGNIDQGFEFDGNYCPGCP